MVLDENSKQWLTGKKYLSSLQLFKYMQSEESMDRLVALLQIYCRVRDEGVVFGEETIRCVSIDLFEHYWDKIPETSAEVQFMKEDDKRYFQFT